MVKRWTLDAENVRGELIASWTFATRRAARREAAELRSPLYSLVLHRTGDDLADREVLYPATPPHELLDELRSPRVVP